MFNLTSGQTDVVRIVAIIAISVLLYIFAEKILTQLLDKVLRVQNKDGLRDNARLHTIARAFAKIVRLIVFILALLLILEILGFALAPFLAGAGVIGIAIGFGAQEVVKNFIAGFFVLIENQYKIGDTVKLADRLGIVESIGLRSTVIRDFEGVVHYIPNSHVDVASNYSIDFTYINFLIGVSYSSDINKVKKVVDSLGEELANDEVWGSAFIEPITLLRVDDFNDSSVSVRIFGTIRTENQFEVESEVKKRIKVAFEQNGIEIPFPQLVLHQK